jgi:pimeloyl-ACP methyl ester carboxylesterase
VSAPARVSVLGRTVHELRGGRGRPLLYLHSAMGESSMWLPYLEALAADREVHAPMHPGFGKSDGLDQIRDIEDLVWHYLAYFDALGWRSVDVVGVSLGGWIAAELAARYPERVASLVLVGSVGIWVAERPIADIFVLDLDHPERAVELVFHDQSCPAAQMLRAMMGVKHLPDELLADLLGARAATAKLGWNPLLHDPRLEALLPRVSARTLCLWGAEDRVVPPVYGERFARGIPNASLRVVPDCGHMLPLERPAEFTAAVDDFLRARPRTGSMRQVRRVRPGRARARAQLDELALRVHAELSEHRLEVAAHGVRAEEQRASDLGDPPALEQVAHDLELARRQDREIDGHGDIG